MSNDNNTRNDRPNRSWLLPAALLVILVAYTAIDQLILTPRIAYVDTGKLMVGFNEAAKVEGQLKAEEEKWQAQLKLLQDSLQTNIDRMTKEYDKASASRKRELQDMLSARNQQINNFRQANLRKMEEMRQKNMQGIFDKVNVYLTEYGKRKRYSIVFGTGVGGSILYGDVNRFDITVAVIKGLNDRYR